MNIPGGRKELLSDLRAKYHAALLEKLVRVNGDGVLNMADKGSKLSKAIARSMIHAIQTEVAEGEITPQGKGASFAVETADFLKAAFSRLQHIRPGDWSISTSQGSEGIARYAQYAHVTELERVLQKYPELRSTFSGDYLIIPDIAVSRRPFSDEEINTAGPFVSSSDRCARRTPIREGNLAGNPSILHASISVKWSIRSDRGQNSRTEALNLIRNRKGQTPRIMVVTFEPLPNRIASIAMGTGDVDCTYHAALDELLEATREADVSGAQLEFLETLIDGQRLRDISDLPLDLAS
jgi:hypothetical protein